MCLNLFVAVCLCTLTMVRLRIGSINLGTMVNKEEEVMEMMDRRNLDFCCVQETRWRGEGAKLFQVMKESEHKFFWKGNAEGTGGVGIVVGGKWIEDVIEVVRKSERIIVLRVRVGEMVLNIISVYAPQVNRPVAEKDECFTDLLEVVSRVHRDEKLIICGDMNGHVGRNIAGFPGVHGGQGYGERNAEGERLLEFAEAMELVVCNTWFKKRQTQLITYRSADHSTVTDYVLERKKSKMVKDVKVVPGEACAPQHELLVSILELHTSIRKKRFNYIPRIKVWRLKDPEIQAKFQGRILASKRPDGLDVDSTWNELKSCLLESASSVCGCTKGPPRHQQTWWWNDEAAEAVKCKRQCYKKMKKRKTRASKAAYKTAKVHAKHVVDKLKENERVSICNRLEEADGKGDLYRVVKQLTKENKDIVGSAGVKDSSGQIVTDDDKVMKVWEQYFKNLLNDEVSWNRSSLDSSDSNNNKCEPVTIEEVREAMNKMKWKKAAGPTGVSVEILKAAGLEGIEWITEVCNAVIRDGRIPEDWKKSWITAVFKGKGDAMNCSSYRGIKLLEHAMKVMERVLESRLRKEVGIDEMQFGFRPGKGTTDAIFILRQIQEKFLEKRSELWLAFVDLEKAFDRVPRDVVWWALRQMGVTEGLIQVVKSMYDGVMTAVKGKNGESDYFEVTVGLHQGSVLSPLLFIIVMEAISKTFRGGLPLELLYADDLALAADSRDHLVEKLQMWKDGLEDKGLRVNVDKTKVMCCTVIAEETVDSCKYPCGVCRKSVGCNSILCNSCDKWIHHRCSGVKGRFKNFVSYTCPVCTRTVQDQSASSTERMDKLFMKDGACFEIVNQFCYLGDMIGAGGGAGDASRTRVRSGWKKFHELAPVLTLKGASHTMKGKIYSTCVRSAMVYGSETWPMKDEDLHRLQRAEKAMMRRMCGVTLRDRVATEELYSRLGIDNIAKVVTKGRLRWFGHVERKSDEDWTKRCTTFEVEGVRGRGRPRKTWKECVNGDLKRLKLDRGYATDRGLWRTVVDLSV